MRTTSAIPQSRTLMRGLILGDKYARDAAEEMSGHEIGTGPSALAALKDAGALWTVETTEAFQRVDGKYVEVPDAAHVRRTDTNQVLGTVTPSYSVYQNEEMGTWADLLVDVASADHVGAVTINGGKRVMVLIKLQASQLAISVGDDVTPTMVVGTGHDGGTSLFAATMAFRQVCANTLHWNIPKLQAVYRIRHTRNMQYQVQEAQRALNLATTWAEAFDHELEQLLDREVGYLAAAQLLEQVWPTSEDEDINPRTRTNRVHSHNGVMAARAGMDDRFRDTGWGFINAVTEWEQWDRAGTRISGPERHLRAISGGQGGYDRTAGQFRSLILAN